MYSLFKYTCLLFNYACLLFYYTCLLFYYACLLFKLPGSLLILTRVCLTIRNSGYNLYRLARNDVGVAVKLVLLGGAVVQVLSVELGLGDSSQNLRKRKWDNGVPGIRCRTPSPRTRSAAAVPRLSSAMPFSNVRNSSQSATLIYFAVTLSRGEGGRERRGMRV